MTAVSSVEKEPRHFVKRAQDWFGVWGDGVLASGSNDILTFECFSDLFPELGETRTSFNGKSRIFHIGRDEIQGFRWLFLYCFSPAQDSPARFGMPVGSCV